MKITDKRPATSLTMSVHAIPVGTVCSGSIGVFKNHIFLRGYDCLVSLTDPKNTWHDGNCYFSDTEVFGYRVVGAELIVTEAA